MSKAPLPAEAFKLGHRLLRRPEVELKTGKSRAAIYEPIRAGTFPAPVPIGSNSVAWLEAEVDQWIAARIDERQANRNASYAVTLFQGIS